MPRRLTAKNSRVLRPTMSNYMVTREEVQHYSDEYFKYIKDGTFKIKFYKTYKLEDVKTAHEVCVFILLIVRCSITLTIF